MATGARPLPAVGPAALAIVALAALAVLDTAVLRGAGVGLAIAAPLGPVGMLCVRRTLAEGRASGLATGLGAATVHATYALLAGSGLALGAGVGGQAAAQAAGALVLVCLGARTFRASPVAARAAVEPGCLARAYGSTLLLAAANPLTVVSCAALLGGVAAPAGGDAPLALALGVLAGSALWWALLSGAVDALRGRLDAGALRGVNRCVGGALLVLGVLAFVSAAV